MNTLRTTERNLTHIALGIKPSFKYQRGNNVRTFDYLVGSKIFRRSSFLNKSRLKLRTVDIPAISRVEVRSLSIAAEPKPDYLLNPEKPSPEDAKSFSITPMVPLTQPRFPKNSQALPSVTRVLSATMPASSQFLLDRWKEAMIKKLGVAGFAKYQQETFERGRLLHAVLAKYLLGEGEPTNELSKEVVSNLWKSIYKIVQRDISNVRLVEHIVTHQSMNYRGIVDCVAFYKNELVVIDFKTAEKPKKDVESLYDNPLQVSAYCGAINNDSNIPDSVVDRNVASGLVIVAYVDGSEASVYYFSNDDTRSNWNKWASRFEQYSQLNRVIKKSDEDVLSKTGQPA